MNAQAQEMWDALTVSIAHRMEEKKEIISWTNEELEEFLLDQHLISGNTVNSFLSMIRKVHKYYCEINNVEYKELQLQKPFIEYIDYKRLRSKTILNWSEFMAIRSHLTVVDDYGKERNFRDVVLFELPWLGLSSKEMQYLETDNVEVFFKDGKKRLRLHLQTRKVVVDHPQIIADILGCVAEQYYMKKRVYDIGGKVVERKEERPFLFSKYLLKPLEQKGSEHHKVITQPSNTLQKQLLKIGNLPGSPLEVGSLSVEDIRRSAIMLMINDIDNIRLSGIQASLNKKQMTDLQWLKPVAKRLKEMYK